MTGFFKGIFGGFVAAMFVWLVGMFVYGEWYSFMEGVGHEYRSATVTRAIMSLGFFIGFLVTWCVNGDDEKVVKGISID